MDQTKCFAEQLMPLENVILLEGSGIANLLCFAGPADLDSLLRRLGRHLCVCDKVVQYMVRFFAPQIRFADDERLCQLYAMAKASPMTSTKAVLKVTANIVFDVAFGSGSSAGFSSR